MKQISKFKGRMQVREYQVWNLIWKYVTCVKKTKCQVNSLSYMISLIFGFLFFCVGYILAYYSLKIDTHKYRCSICMHDLSCLFWNLQIRIFRSVPKLSTPEPPSLAYFRPTKSQDEGQCTHTHMSVEKKTSKGWRSNARKVHLVLC
jgi:hypothetical protein